MADGGSERSPERLLPTRLSTAGMPKIQKQAEGGREAAAAL